MKRTILLAIVVLALFLVGCGKDNDSSTTSPTGDPMNGNYTFMMMVTANATARPTSAYVMIGAFNEENPTPISTCSLVFNNQSIALQVSPYYTMGLIQGIEVNQTYPVQVTINGESFSSTLKICPLISSCTQSGNSQTPILNWNFTGDVNAQYVSGISYDAQYNETDYMKSIATNLRTYTYPTKNSWEDLSVMIMNYSSAGSNKLILVSADDSDSGYKKSNNEFFTHIRKVIKKYL